MTPSENGKTTAKILGGFGLPLFDFHICFLEPTFPRQELPIVGVVSLSKIIGKLPAKKNHTTPICGGGGWCVDRQIDVTRLATRLIRGEALNEAEIQCTR